MFKLKIKKQFLKLNFIFSFFVFFSAFQNQSKAIIIDDNLYIRARAFSGFEFQFSRFDDREIIHGKKNKTNYVVPVGIGANLYFNIYETLNPFVGIEFIGRIPMNNSGYKNTMHLGMPAVVKYREIFLTHLKLGVKAELTQGLDVLPYGIVGFNVSEIKTKVYDLSKTKNQVNLSIGFGAELLLYDTLFIGAEYRYSTYNDNRVLKIDNHNLSFKAGFEFL